LRCYRRHDWARLRTRLHLYLSLTTYHQPVLLRRMSICRPFRPIAPPPNVSSQETLGYLLVSCDVDNDGSCLISRSAAVEDTPTTADGRIRREYTALESRLLMEKKHTACTQSLCHKASWTSTVPPATTRLRTRCITNRPVSIC
jgi:hypothetical protein